MAAQTKQGNVLDLKYSIEDSSIVYPESFDSDSQKLLESWYLKNYTTASSKQKGSNTDPGATDAEIMARLASLPTEIDMPFNSIVKSYIERYTKKGRKQVTALLGLSSYYMPIFEQALSEAGLPLELKYLPVIESSLNPNAVSKHGAAGLWQFIVSAAKGYDMEVNSLVDERRDPYISSERACRLLKDLYNTYGDWSLAIAAYNCGPGNVNKALHRAGGDPKSHDFWSIYYYLPAETRGYVPLFIAANYVMNYYPEHRIEPVLITRPLVTDTIHVYDRVHFNQIAAVLDLPVEEIRTLNPQFRTDLIPGSEAKPYNLILPSQQIHAYIVSEDQILAYDREKYARKVTATPGGDPNEDTEIAEVVEDSEVRNPADLAPAEEIAAQEQVAELTNTDQVATPRRRRGGDTQTNTPAPTQTQPKKNNTQSTQTAQNTTKTNNNTTKTNNNSNTSNKKNNNTQTAQNNTKKNTKNNTTASNNTKNTKNNNNTKKNTKPSSHTVSEGENLTVIAKKNGTTVDALKKANPNLKGDMIHPGDKLSIPKDNKKAANNTKNNNTKNTKNNNNNNTKKKKK